MAMNAHQFQQARQFALTRFGRIAYIERGAGPVALFLHGYPLNGFHWRGVIEDLAASRRCIAPDMMGLGHTEVAADQDLSFEQQARMVASFLDALAIAQVDLIGNDTGGGTSQIFAALYPSRVRTLTLTNCEVNNLWPNATLRGLFETLLSDQAIPQIRAMLDNPAIARAGFSTAYENSEAIPDEAFRTYLEPLLSTDERARNVQRFLCFERDRDQLVAVAPQLKQLRTPTQVIWADDDVFFDRAPSLAWLRENIPGVRKVIEVPKARLFFPEEHPKLVSVLLREFWSSAS